MNLTSITQKVSARIAAGTVGAAMIVSLGLGIAPQAYAAGLTSTQVQSILSLLSSFGADSATIANVNAALNGQATSGTTGGSTSTGGSMCSASFSRDLQVGSTGSDVMALQVFLNSHGAQVAASGAGSPGNETSTFGPATKAAVVKYQTAQGITPASGYVGPKTRANLNAMCGGTSTGGSTTPVATGPGITVSAAAQPANSLAPQNASRVPFTTFTLTNNTSAPVTVNSITVQRSGLVQDAAFAGIVLLDNNGLQVGIAHTFNSNHQSNIGDTFTLAAGQSMTYTVAGNMAADTSTYAGQVASLQVVAVNTSAPVNGALPITGASQTINATLAVGSVSTSTSSYDPGAAQTKNIGDTKVRFSGLRFTASSAEDLKLYSIRWRQVGTASASDFGNAVTIVNGTSYPATLDGSGKYYTTLFPGGILIPKGNSIDAYIQGDITGSNAASRTVDFDIDKVTDVYFVGQLYGYGIAPSGNYQPWYNGRVTTINGGSASVIQNATSVQSQNVPVNVSNTVLGGFQTNFLGEPVSVSGLKFTVATTSAASGLLTSVSIVDQNGNVVAGPVDATWVSGTETLTFTDTVTFPVGLATYTLKGKVSSSATNGGTIALQTTANSTNWSNAVGQTSGNTISLPGTAVTMNTMTVKGATLTVTASPNPVAQSIVAGTSVTLGNVQLDASQSGEDIRLNNLPMVEYGTAGSTGAGALNTCQLYQGSTSLNNGSNVVNSVTNNDAGAAPNSPSGSANVFTFDNQLVVSKGTVVTLTLKCNISTAIAANATTTWGVNSGASYLPTATGVQSGNSLTSSTGLTVTSGVSGVQTVSSSGSLIATAANSAVTQPATTLAAAGTTGVTVGQVKLHASNEALNLQYLRLTIANGTYGSASTGSGGSSNSGVNDVVTAYIYNGAVLVGTATFTGSTQTATSSLSTAVNLPKDTDTYLTIKADLAAIGQSAAGGIGDTLKIDPLEAQASGVSSGQTVYAAATAGVNGIVLFKSYPTVAFVSNSTNPNGTNVVLKKFTVTANAAGPVSLYQLAFKVATSSASVTSFKLYAYTDAAYSQGLSSQSSGTGQIGSTACSSGCTAAESAGTTALLFAAGTNPINIQAGTTLYFALLGTVTPGSTANNWTISPTLQGDSTQITSAATGNGNRNATTTTSNSYLTSNNNFIWSDNATTTVGIADGSVDWTNGYQVPGLPSTGI